MLAMLPTFSQPSRAKANVGPMMNVYWVRRYAIGHVIFKMTAIDIFFIQRYAVAPFEKAFYGFVKNFLLYRVKK